MNRARYIVRIEQNKRFSQVGLPAAVVSAMWSALPEVAEHTVAAVLAEVPTYAEAFDGALGPVIETAVRQGLEGFLAEATAPRRTGGTLPGRTALDGAYTVGRGEARDGRPIDVLLAAYRIGARTAWREMSAIAVSGGISADMLVVFAELVFAYIDQLSACSVSGHGDELAVTGLARQRNRELLAQQLVGGRPPEELAAAAARADWPPPDTLTAVAVPDDAARGVELSLDPRTLRLPEEYRGPDGRALVLLLVPDVAGRRRPVLVAGLAERRAVIGPSRPWLDVASSVRRVMRAVELDLDPAGALDTDDCLTDLVLRADAEALADLRAKVLAPLDGLRPAGREKLIETLRAWLLNHGRREDVAAALYVHPQTVRYRVGQLRELYGDRLHDPATILQLTIALGSDPATM